MPSLPPQHQTGSPRKPLPRKLKAASIAALLLILLSFALRSVLIHRMMLPRLMLYQGGSVYVVAISPDGKTVFTGSDPTHDAAHNKNNKQADVFVWESASGKLIRRLPGLYWRSNAVTASPDGSAVIAYGFTRRDYGPRPWDMPSQIFAWNWRTGRKIWAMGGMMPLCYSPSGWLIGCSEGLREVGSGKLVVKLPKVLQEDGQIKFSSDGAIFGFIGSPTLNKKGSPDSDNGDKIYYSTTRLHLWQTNIGKEVKDFPFTRVRAFDFGRDGQWLVMASDADGMAGGTDGSVVRRIDIKSGAVVWTRTRSMNAPDHDPDAILNSVVISPNGKYIVVQSISNQVIVLDAATGDECFRPYGSQNMSAGAWALPSGLAFSTDGRKLVSRCGPCVLVWDASRLQ